MAKNSVLLNVWLVLCLTGGGLHAQVRPPTAVSKLIEVTDELPCDPEPTVFIGNSIRRVTVLTTHEHKVRLVTTVAYEGTCRYTNEEWLDILELRVAGDMTNVKVKCGNMPDLNIGDPRLFRAFSKQQSKPPVRLHRMPDLPQRRTLNDLTPSGTVVFDDSGHWLYKKGNIRRDIIVYVPVGSTLDIDSRYAEIILDSNIRVVNARIMNGGLTMKDADKLFLNSAYGSVYASNIGHAEVTSNNGWFHAKDIPTLEINSKVSTVELGAIGQLKINSNDDQYDMEAAGVISGEKNYGSFRVDTLRNSLDLTGVNADVKIHNIEPDVSVVKIDGQYADLRLPVDNLKDYTVHFEGTGSNLYTPFKIPHATDSVINITIGTGIRTSIRLKCSNCTLDMK